MVNWVVDDGFGLVSKSVWDDENRHNMTGDTTTPDAGQGGSEKPRRHVFWESKTTSISLWKWKRTARSDQPAFSDFHSDSIEFDSEVLNHKRVMSSGWIPEIDTHYRLLIERCWFDKDAWTFKQITLIRTSYCTDMFKTVSWPFSRDAFRTNHSLVVYNSTVKFVQNIIKITEGGLF